MHGFRYQGDTFTLDLPVSWQDETVYVLNGPVEDDLQHVITINVDPAVSVNSLLDYVDLQVQAQMEAVKGFRLLLKKREALNSGLPAYRVVSLWCPVEGREYYQEQWILLKEQAAYKLAATFTKRTRKTLGPQVERMMRAFDPRPGGP
jgi:hypothetical protein